MRFIEEEVCLEVEQCKDGPDSAVWVNFAFFFISNCFFLPILWDVYYK